MEDRYVLEITKEGKTPGENVVKVRLEIDGDRMQAVIAAAMGLPIPRAVRARPLSPTPSISKSVK